MGAHLVPLILKFRERNGLLRIFSPIRDTFCHNPPQSQARVGKHPPTCNSPACPSTWWTSGELLMCAERWQDMVREKLFTFLLGRWAEDSKKMSISYLRSFFLGRHDKYSPYDCDPYPVQWNAADKGGWHLWEAPHILSLSRMLITVPGTGSPVSKLKYFLEHMVQGFACSLAAAEPKQGGGGLCSRI